MVQTSEQLVSTQAERYLLVYMVVVLLIITALVIIFFIVFQKRKNKLLLDKIKQQQAFEEEIAKTQTEIQEQTLKQIGWELHDNVGQLLSYANMQLNMVAATVPETLKNNIVEVSKTVKDSLQEVRAISKTLNSDVILNVGLIKAVSNEIERLKRLKFKTVTLAVEGEQRPITNKKHELVLFRMLQEVFSNAVKYSEAHSIKVVFVFLPETLLIKVADDGVGFDMTTVEKGAGLLNIQSRAQLIEANATIQSVLGEGTQLTVAYPLH